MLDSPNGLLSAIVSSADEAIIAKTVDGTIISWNAAAERLYGYSAEEALGQRVALIIPADRQGEMRDILARIKRGEHVQRFETVRQRRDGSLVEVSVTISPVLDDGVVIGASAIARDITKDRAEIELSRRRALQIHDQIVQGLVLVKLATETGDEALAARRLDQTLAAAKRLVADVLAGQEITPERLRHDGPS